MTTNNKIYDLIIIGGGIAGLSSAYFAQKKDLDFLLIESQNRLGGVISTERLENNYIAEKGPNSLALGETIQEIVQDLNLNLIPSKSEARKKIIYAKNKLIALSGLGGLLQLLSLKSLFSILKEPFKKASLSEENISIGDFFANHFSSEIVDNLLFPILTGIYAGNPYKLELQSVFPQIYALSQKHPSLLMGLIKEKPKFKLKRQICSFDNGLSSLTEGIQNFIPKQKILLENPIKSLKPNNETFILELENGQNLMAQKIIMSVPSHIAQNLYPELLSDLAQIYYAPIITLNFWLKTENKEFENAFGFLTARGQNSPLLGTIFSSSLFENRAPAGWQALTCFIGGANYPEFINIPIEEVKEQIIQELKKTLSVQDDNAFDLKTCKYWDKGIPQYNIGHTALIERIQNKLPINLKLAGNYLKGISLEDTILSGKKALESIL